jgi:hypothetical protein
MLYRRASILATFLLAALLSPSAQTARPADTNFHVGLQSIAIPPPPSTTLVETGPDYRVLLDNLADARDRIVAGFLLPNELAAIQAGKSSLSRYCLVEVLRAVEFTDVSADSFHQFVDAVGQQYGAVIPGALKDEQEDIDHKLKMLGSGSTITIDKPLQLGRLYGKQDAAGFGMIVPVNVNGAPKKVTVVSALIRVHDRVLFLYTYSPYTDEDSVKWASSTSEKWADAVLASNK